MGTHPIFESDFDCLTETGLQKHSAAMFMDRKVRDKIYTTLFQDGVMVAEKICKRNAGRMHNDVKDVPNLNVIKACLFDFPRLPQAAVRLATLLRKRCSKAKW